MPDVGLTHVALVVTDPAASEAFYREYAGLEVVHRRASDDGRGDVLWLSDGRRPFVIVLLPGEVTHPLGGTNHLGVGCANRGEVDDLLERAGAEGRTTKGPMDYGPPVGYWGLIEDPDGHVLEVSYGQEVGLAVDRAGAAEPS